jgi:hypothetical protein
MRQRGDHLTEEQICVCVVDQTDLAEDARDHLLTCPVCRDAKATLEFDLERLGEMARGFVPAPTKKIEIPLKKSRGFGFRLPAFAAAAAAVLFVVMFWGPGFFSDGSKQEGTNSLSQSDSDLYLVEDILDESPLPDYYLDIAVASYGYIDDEFLELIAPIDEPGDTV